MDGKQKGTERSRNRRKKGIMLGVCTLIFLGVLLTGCFALGYKGGGAPAPTVPVKKPEAQFVEVMACDGGCVNGPCSLAPLTLAKRQIKKALEK